LNGDNTDKLNVPSSTDPGDPGDNIDRVHRHSCTWWKQTAGLALLA
jgi:hypothetical protein